jgi:DNA polymerase zeta
VENWYDSMPRIKRAGKYDFRSSTNGGGGGGGGGIRIDSHFKSSHCVVCGLESSTGMSFRPIFLYSCLDILYIQTGIPPLFNRTASCYLTLADLAEICAECTSDPSRTSHTLLSRTHLAQSRLSAIHRICSSCSSTPIAEPVMCDSIDCPVMYQRVRAVRDVEDLKVNDGVLGVVTAEGDAAGKEVEGVEGKKPFWEAMEW